MKIEYTHTVTTYEEGKVNDRYIVFHEFADLSWKDPKLGIFYFAYEKTKLEIMRATKRMLPLAKIKEKAEFLTVYLEKCTDGKEDSEMLLTEWFILTERIYRKGFHEAKIAEDENPSL